MTESQIKKLDLAIGPIILNHNIVACMLCQSQNFKDLDIYLRIEENATAALRMGIDDITGFDGL